MAESRRSPTLKIPQPDVEDSTKLLIQYVESVRDFSSQYGSERSISYTVFNLIGEQKYFIAEDDTDSSQFYLPRSYGPWWKMAPSGPKMFKEKLHHLYPSQDFVELKYKECVYPSTIEINELGSCSGVSKILACDLYTFKWHVIWEKKSDDDYFVNENHFSPPLKRVNFATNLIRLEFHHAHLEYYSKFKSICLIGVRDEKIGSNLQKDFSNTVYIDNKFNFSKLCGLNELSSQLDSSFSTKNYLEKPAFDEFEVKEQKSRADDNYLEKLPKEIIHTIVKYLDLPSLCKASISNNLLRQQCYDPLLFVEIDLQPYWHMISDRALVGLQSRFTKVQRLNLSWCGNNGSITTRGLTRFLSLSCRNLTGLYLSCCTMVNAIVLDLLPECIPKLEELDLSNCNIGAHNGIEQISRLYNLKRLNLCNTLVDLPSLISILCNSQDLEFLNLDSCTAIGNYDEALNKLSENCRNLKGLDVWRAKSLSSVGIRHLYTLSQLEELDIGWCVEVSPVSGCLHDLARSCPALKKLILSGIRSVCDNDILLFAETLSNLEQLDILGTRGVTAASCYRLISMCPKLKLLDISYCDQIDSATVIKWKEEFSNVSIKQYS